MPSEDPHIQQARDVGKKPFGNKVLFEGPPPVLARYPYTMILQMWMTCPLNLKNTKERTLKQIFNILHLTQLD